MATVNVPIGKTALTWVRNLLIQDKLQIHEPPSMWNYLAD